MTDVLDALRRLISTEHHVPLERLTEEAGLADLGLDSLAVAELLFDIEDQLGVVLTDIEPEQIPATLGGLAALVGGRQAG